MCNFGIRHSKEMDVGVLIFILVIGGTLPLRAAEKRAISPHHVPLYNGNDGKNITEKGDNSVTYVKICPLGQLPQKDNHNNTVCCWPTACEKDHYIIKCTKDGGQDRCERCDEGTVQPNYVTSADPVETRCFPYNARKHSACPRSDTKLNAGHYSEQCPYWCSCDTDRCFYGDPCHCSSILPCGINEEMDPVTKRCKRCPDFAYKNVEGCQRCVINVTLWRLGVPDHDKVSPTAAVKVTTPPEVHTDTKDVVSPELATSARTTRNRPPGDDGDNGLLTELVVLLLVLIIGMVGVLIFITIWRRRDSTQHSQWSSLLSKFVSRCLPQKSSGSLNSESTVTTPLSEHISLLDDVETFPDKASIPPITRTSEIIIEEETELKEVINEEENEQKEVEQRSSNSGLEIVYDRTGEAKNQKKEKESLGFVRRENPVVMKQNSITVDAEVHSSSSGNSSDMDETTEDLAAIETEDKATRAPGPSLVGSAGPVKVATIHKEVPAQGPSLNKGKLLSRGQNQESDVDTGICMEPVMMELHSVPCRGEEISDGIPSINTTDSVPPGERVVIGQSASPSIRNARALNLKMPSSVESTERSRDPVVPPPATPSPRIRLPESPSAFIGTRQVACISPLTRVDEMHDFQSGLGSTDYMADTNPSVPSYILGDSIGNTGDFTGDYASSASYRQSPFRSSINYARGPPYFVPTERYEPDGASGQTSAEDGPEQTHVKELASGPESSEETFKKYVDTDNTSPKTVDAMHDNVSGKLKLETSEGEDIIKGKIVEVTKDSSSVAGGGKGLRRTASESPVLEGEDCNMVMEDLKTSDMKKSAEETHESDTNICVSNICDSRENPNPVGILQNAPEVSFELPNDALEQSDALESESNMETEGIQDDKVDH